MSKNAHTPGPWTVHTGNDGRPYIVRDDAKGWPPLGKAYRDSIDGELPGEANARLISAAPDLLAALEEAVLQIEYLHAKSRQTGSGNTVVERARAAISKAKGEA